MQVCGAKHNIFIHFPKDPNCPVCNETRIQRARCAEKTEHEPEDLPEPKKFGDALTADHAIVNEDDRERDRDKVALVILDKFSRWLQSFPCPNKSAKETIKAFQQFLGPQLKAKHVFSDNSGELIQAMDEMMISHDT